MINVGIIGVGRWGLNYLKTFNEFKNSKAKWISSRREDALKSALLKAGTKINIKATTDYNDILRDKEVSAVIIATPGSTHYKISKEALLSNKHILTEKPVAFSSKEVEELIALSNKRKKIFMAGHLHLYNPPIQKLREDIKAGSFGEINYIHSIGTGNGPVRNDMNVLWDVLPHDISVLLYLLDELPLSVSVNGASYIKEGIEDIVTMDLVFPKNVFATAMASWLHPLKQRNLVIASERLFATFCDYAENERLKYYPRGINKKRHTAPKIEIAKPLTLQLKHFLDCIENNKSPLTDGNEALKVTKVLESAQKSLDCNGKTIKIY